MQKSETLLTKSKTMAIFFVNVNEAYQMTVLLPMVVFMCRDFGITAQWLGVYTSVLNASFGFCQFFVCYLWGYMSDIHGRRLMVMLGLTGTFVSMTLFGFSTSFEMALLCRCFTGVFNGNLAVIVAYCADITNSSNRAMAFTILAVAWGAGSVLGSMLGGILLETNPVDVSDEAYIATTSVLKWSIFEHQFPFLLPTGVCGGIITFNALIWTFLFIKDVEKVKHSSHVMHYVDMTHMSDTMSIASDIEMASTTSDPPPFRTTRALRNEPEPRARSEHLAMYQSLPSHHDLKAMIATFEPDQIKLLTHVRENQSIDDTLQIRTVSDMLKYTKLSHILMQYGIVVIAFYMFKEMGPVYMAQALEFNSVYIGYTQVVAGATYFVFALTVQPMLLRKYPHHVLTAICVVIRIVCALLMPSIYWFTLIEEDESQFAFMKESWWLLLMACVVEWIATMASSIGFVVVLCWVNNSVPEANIGKANGIAQTMSAFVKGFGPLLTGFIWSESVAQIESHNRHYAVYYAYLPTAIVYIPQFIDIVLYTPASLQLTWEQRQQESKQWKDSCS